ncbi:MAG: hypothetical protein V8R10_13035 [Christensenellales bacterium]
MKKLLCLLLTLLLIHPALAEDALDAPDAASLLPCANGALLAVSPDLRVLRRDTAGDWALVLSAEQISAACPPRFMPDAANALLLPGENGAYALLLLPDTSGQIAVLSLTGATCELTRVFADFLPTDSEMPRSGRSFPPRAPETRCTLPFQAISRHTAPMRFRWRTGRLFCFRMRRFAS